LIEDAVLQRTLQSALRHGGDFAEVFAEDRRVASARLDDGKVEEFVSGRERGAGIRVVRGDTTGFAHTADLSETGLRMAADAASPQPTPGGLVFEAETAGDLVVYPCAYDAPLNWLPSMNLSTMDTAPWVRRCSRPGCAQD